MSEYIEREALLKEIRKQLGSIGEHVLILIAHLPTADVEPVVRCPNCINGQRENNVWTRCAKDGTRRLDNFYCAHGKERER